MKVTIDLTDIEVKAIKKYLFDTSGEKANNDDVKDHIKGIVSSVLYSPSEAVSDYITELNQTNQQ